MGRRERPVVRAVVIFVILIGLFYAFVHTPVKSHDPFRPFLAFLAHSVASLLGLVGYESTVEGATIHARTFSMEIVRGCDAIEPLAIFAAAVLASPVSGWWFKAPLGILAGGAALLLINIVRLVSLFYVGIHYPSLFDLVHEQVWQMVFIVLAVTLWAVWVQWATKSKRGDPTPQAKQTPAGSRGHPAGFEP